MLSAGYLKSMLTSALPDVFKSPESQILECDGFDAIIEILKTLRSVEFPLVILEGRSSGQIKLVEGPLDVYTESLWIMAQFGRGESEADVYRDMYALSLRILTRLLADASSGVEDVCNWDWQHISYMKRDGGPNARGFELVLTFKDNISLRDG